MPEMPCARRCRVTRQQAWEGSGMNVTAGLAHRLHEEEVPLLARLGALRRANRAKQPSVTVGQVVADKVAAVVGSWRFILIQSGLLAIWIALNLTAYIQHWDPYPFILL